MAGRKKKTRSKKRKKKGKASARRRTVKAVKELSRRTKARPTQAHGTRRPPRKKRKMKELLEEEDW
ncbi:MAG: hypothetical protein V3V11_01580 [Vicinamibacteria bacterium]